MTPLPETRYSLILRLPNQRDINAWEEFVAIYEPLVYRLALMNGFQDADAREVVQEVLIAVSRAVERWEPDEERGRFRSWLFRIARNLMVNIATRRKFRAVATGDVDLEELLDEQVHHSPQESSTFELEYRREVFHWAAQRVRRQVREKTWKAFWMTNVESQSVDQVAQQLEMSVGAVHVARSRVLGRMREIVKTFEDGERANSC